MVVLSQIAMTNLFKARNNVFRELDRFWGAHQPDAAIKIDLKMRDMLVLICRRVSNGRGIGDVSNSLCVLLRVILVRVNHYEL